VNKKGVSKIYEIVIAIKMKKILNRMNREIIIPDLQLYTSETFYPHLIPPKF